MNQAESPDSDSLPDPRLKLWHALAAIGALSVVFALLFTFNMTSAIGFVLAGLVFLGIQALLLAFVMRWLRQKAALEEKRD